jgi:hypothetical protein
LAADHPAEQQILDSARNPFNLFQSKANPFHLEIEFTVESPRLTPGHLSIKWQSSDHWWSKIEAGGFEQTTIRVGEEEYTARNFPFTPTLVRDIFRLLQFNVDIDKSKATRLKNRIEDGVPVSCIEADIERFKGNKTEICLDTASHEVQSVGWQSGPDEKDIETFRGYSDIGGTLYPKKFELLKNGKLSISANVATLETADFDPALLIPPKGAIERRKCPGIKPPQFITRPEPNFPRSVDSGSVSAEVTVLADGSIGDIQIMSATNAEIRQDILEVFRKVKYAPAMCGTDPVVAEDEVVWTFHRN